MWVKWGTYATTVDPPQVGHWSPALLHRRFAALWNLPDTINLTIQLNCTEWVRPHNHTVPNAAAKWDVALRNDCSVEFHRKSVLVDPKWAIDPAELKRVLDSFQRLADD